MAPAVAAAARTRSGTAAAAPLFGFAPEAAPAAARRPSQEQPGFEQQKLGQLESACFLTLDPAGGSRADGRGGPRGPLSA